MPNAIQDVTIVSLSSGVLGEDFVAHERAIGLKRLEAMGLGVRFSAHCLCGLDYIRAHPEARAQDLLDAFRSDTDMILCAIGGEDSYRLLPWLFAHDELKEALQKKVFLGFSDSTVSHLMLHKLGLNSFYGQAFLPDVCELAPDMLPYSKAYFLELIRTGTIRRIVPSARWYEARQDFSAAAVGSTLPEHEDRGFVPLQGAPVFRGPILGGCLDTLFDLFDPERYADSPALCRRYGLFPALDDWRGKILLLETSEELAPPEKFRRMVRALKETGIFAVLSGVLLGKPVNELYFDAYAQILLEEIARPELPIAANINVGHALPRCIIPFGVEAVVDITNQEIRFGTGGEQ